MSTVPTNRETASTAGTQPAWKRELNEKIAAARARRQGQEPAQGEVLRPGEADPRVSRVAARVAARYAQAPTYSEYLASEIRSAVMAAAPVQDAAAQARTAEEIQQAREAASAQLLLTTPAPLSSQPSAETAPGETLKAPRSDAQIAARSVQEAPIRDSKQPSYVPATTAIEDPLADAMVTPAIPLPAKLLEFPRELVAARRARPRHAEGPLREESSGTPQLRIFEVEAEAISTAVEPAPRAPEWSSIRLGAYSPDYAVHSTAESVSSYYSPSAHPVGVAAPRHDFEQVHPKHTSYGSRGRLLKVASLEDRLMAAMVDVAMVGIAFVLFTFVFATGTMHAPTGKPALLGGALVFAGIYLLYQLLFFTFADGTPGMLYARIALCTFDDDNPTRTAMRKRIFALVLAAMPLGLGFLYAIFDEDHLAWHDRMTRMYQRSYK